MGRILRPRPGGSVLRDAHRLPRHSGIRPADPGGVRAIGAAPAQWAVARGFPETGVTIMQMDEGLDTGDIRLQRALPVAPDETGESLLAKLGPLGASALEEALRLLAAGELSRKPQDHAKAT